MPRYRLVAVLTAFALFAVACAGDDQDNAADTVGIEDPNGASADDRANEVTGEGSGLLITDEPVRFSQLDWRVLGAEIRPDGPGDDGEDIDPTEDFVYVDLEVSSPAPTIGLKVPVGWVGVVDAQGTLYRAASTDDRYESRIDVEPQETVERTAVIPVASGTSLEGGWVELDQEGRLPAALGGPRVVDEAARLPVTFDTTTYEGPLSRDAARVDILEAFWSRELGFDSTGAPLEPPTHGTMRPAEGHVFLLVHYEITGKQVSANTGGVNHGAGLVIVDGEGELGADTSDGLVDYDETEDAWAVYEVSVNAQSVTVAICDCTPFDDGGQTNFNVTDFGPLEQLATPEA